MSLGLTLTENLVTLNPSKSRLIKIPVFNSTAKDIFIRSGSLMGNLQRVATAIPLESKPMEIPADVSKIDVDIEALKTKPNDFQDLTFTIYPKINEYESKTFFSMSVVFFSKNDSDIETIESFKLKLNVTDSKPV